MDYYGFTIEKWRPIANDSLSALYQEFVAQADPDCDIPPLISVVELEGATAHVFSFALAPTAEEKEACAELKYREELMIVMYGSGKPVTFRRRP